MISTTVTEAEITRLGESWRIITEFLCGTPLASRACSWRPAEIGLYSRLSVLRSEESVMCSEIPRPGFLSQSPGRFFNLAAVPGPSTEPGSEKTWRG
jgi:hypothetical protein